MDDFTLGVLLILPIVIHATVAYLTVLYVFKSKGKDLENWITGPKADQLWSKVGDKLIDRLLIFLEKDERSGELALKIMALFKHHMIQGIKEYIGGLETGTKNQIKAIASNQMADIGAAIKGFIFNKIGKMIEGEIEGKVK